MPELRYLEGAWDRPTLAAMLNGSPLGSLGAFPDASSEQRTTEIPGHKGGP